MMPPPPPLTKRGVKNEQSTCNRSGKCGRWTMAGHGEQQERAADEGNGEEGENSEGNGDGDKVVG